MMPKPPKPATDNSSPTAELVRHHRPPDVLTQAAGQGLRTSSGEGIGEGIADAAKINIEIFGSRRPVRAEHAKQVQLVLDAAADRGSRLAVGERRGKGRGRGLGQVLLHS